MTLCACGCGDPVPPKLKCGPPPIYATDACARRAQRARNLEAHRRRDRANDLRTKYGMTLEQFDAMLVAQDSKCAICRGDDPGVLGWTVDHDHTTRQVRGILCNSCNKALGLLRDDLALIRAAEGYLARFTLGSERETGGSTGLSERGEP